MLFSIIIRDLPWRKTLRYYKFEAFLRLIVINQYVYMDNILILPVYTVEASGADYRRTTDSLPQYERKYQL